MNEIIRNLEKLPPERAAYTLNELVPHLAAADEYAKLSTLFERQDWLFVRMSRSGNHYDGYLTDLQYASIKAYMRSEEQIKQGHAPPAFVDCARYELIRESFQDLATTLPPMLVAQAARTGLWTIERAVSLVPLVRDDWRRAELCLALLQTGMLTGILEQEAMRSAFQAA